MAGTIRRSGRLLMSVLDDVLDYARLDKGKLELDARVVDPTEVLRSTVEVFAQEASNADLGLTWSTRGDIPEFVVLDEARVGQVLGNLVANAIKFTRWGAIHLSLHATPLGGGGTTLTYAVSDTGVGIPKDRLGEIFEPFTQSGPHARRHGGSGLGLSICRRLAEHMNGELSAVSAPGIGSTFRLRLPAEVVDEAPPDHQDATDLAESLDGLHVLIVDDNSVNRFVVRKMLHSLGAEVSEAASGEEALAWLSRSEADVVLLDIEMPGMDGYDTCRHLRAREDEPNIVIALSAYALPEHEERAMEVGIDGYMHKPTTRALLSSTILHHVGDAQVAPVA
jgi:CheY-like chemotaxis protein